MLRTSRVLLCLAALCTSATAQPHYAVTVIGGLPQSAPTGPLSLPMALNNNGRVVGYSYNTHGTIEALNWKAGAVYSLSGTANFTTTFANRVNLYGRIAGSGSILDASGATVSTHALKWTGGLMSDLGGLGGSHAAALAINDHEQIVGYASLSGDMQVRAFLYQNGAMAAINTFPGTSEAYAYDISNTAFVVGTCIAGSPAKPFEWRSGTVMALPIPISSRTGAANAVNDAGIAAGTWEANQYTGSFVACVWVQGQRMDLPNLGGPLAYAVASDINNSDQVVGTSNSPAGHTGFLFQNGRMYDLRTLVSIPLAITSAHAINDHGQIAAGALIGGRETAVLLTPVSSGVSGGPSPIGD